MSLYEENQMMECKLKIGDLFTYNDDIFGLVYKVYKNINYSDYSIEFYEFSDRKMWIFSYTPDNLHKFIMF